MSMTIEEAKALLTEKSMNKLKELVLPKPTINTSNKVNNDILMNALCTAVENGVIHVESLTPKIMKLLNSATNTLSPVKLGDILSQIRENQPNICCEISIKNRDGKLMESWIFVGPVCNLNSIFEYVVKEFDITPQLVRTKMVEMLKSTIVNNIAQLVAKYETLNDDEKEDVNISITTISRIVNMAGYMIFAEFKEL